MDAVAALIVLWIVMWCVLKFLVVCAKSYGFEAKPWYWFKEFRSMKLFARFVGVILCFNFFKMTRPCPSKKASVL